MKILQKVPLLLMLSAFLGCSGSGEHSAITNSTWLAVVEHDTLTVSMAIQQWNRLDQDGKRIFLESETPSREFIASLVNKMLVQREMEAGDYYADPLLNSMKNSWLRMQSAEAAIDFFLERSENSVTESDLAFYRNHIGKTVWHTVHPETDSSESMGPNHLPKLQRDIALALDSISVGRIIELPSGVSVRLDSIVVTDPDLVAETLADTARFEDMAISRLAQARNRRWYDSIRNNLMRDFSMEVDTAGLQRLAEYYSTGGDLPPETVVIRSDLGSWTSSELRSELAFLETVSRIQPAELAWQLFFVENLLFHTYLQDTLQRSAPGISDSLRELSRGYLQELALEEFYIHRISSGITITEDDLTEQFQSYEEPPMLDERRSIELVRIPEDSLVSCRRAIEAGDLDDFLRPMSGFPQLVSQPEDPHLTRPLFEWEIPGGYGERVFAASPSDTASWLGPFPLAESMEYIMFRLVEVFPPRAVVFEEFRPELEVIVRSRMEEEAAKALVEELRDKYETELNEGAISGLPANPDTWELNGAVH
ncbi:MAG: hypothetical protein GF388_09655 [Candidatus Aegiribacteria sp.]|nr:hypothetical protein [Candidatus Aegiribacteria sp.]MBD3295303.1 hypothetical protein [Candidatus Fermentibacteria bacterium]